MLRQPGPENSYTTELLYSSGVLSLQDRKQLEFVVRQFKINLHGLFSKRRVLLMNFLVKILPYLPINGSLIHILGRSSGVARSARSTCGMSLLPSFSCMRG